MEITSAQADLLAQMPLTEETAFPLSEDECVALAGLVGAGLVYERDRWTMGFSSRVTYARTRAGDIVLRRSIPPHPEE